MKVKIIYLPTQNEVNELDLFAATVSKGECIIGRSPDCDLPLESPDVSRLHGKFFVQGGKYYYCDTGSRNGSIINNILAEKNLPYILNHEDSIQIGDYVLMVEDIKPLPEQLPETVFRVIDPALFSRPVSENVNVADITNVEPEAVSEFSGEVISPPSQEEVPAPEVIHTASSENEEVITAPENQIVEEKIFVQSQDIASQLREIVPDMATNNRDEEVNLSPPILEELTTVQPHDLNISPSATDTYEEVDLDIDDGGEEESLEVVREVHLEATTDIATVTEETSIERSDTVSQPEELVSNVDAEAPESVPDALNESQAEVIIAPVHNIDSQFENVNVANITNVQLEAVSEFSGEVISPLTQEEVPAPEVIHTGSSENQEVITAPENQIVEEKIFVQSQDIASQLREMVTDVATNNRDEDVDLSAPILEELTTVQPRDLNIAPSVTDTYEEVDLDISAPILEELTTVQPRDLNISPSVTDTYEEVDLDIDDGGEEESLEVVREVHPEATTDIATVTEETSIERSDTVSQPEELVSNVDAEAPESVPDALNESQAEVIIAPVPNIDSQAEVTEVFSNEDVDFSSTSLEEVNQEVTAADTVSTVENLEIDATTEVSDTPEPVSQILEAVSKAEEVPDIDNVEANTESEASQMNIQKNIVLIAHESNKSELADLVAQHQEFFSQSVTISWPSVSEVLKQQAGITVSEEIPPPTSGGYQRINLLLNAGDILAVIFLRDFLTTQAGQANEEAFLRICNINQVLVATNFKTAQAIIHYLKNISH
jgi:methylglyoxal synthase/pSer/pThr/pTyr-binding forkhead associated (FHA) protein